MHVIGGLIWFEIVLQVAECIVRLESVEVLFLQFCSLSYAIIFIWRMPLSKFNTVEYFARPIDTTMYIVLSIIYICKRKFLTRIACVAVA